MPSGPLRDRVRLESRQALDDGGGNPVSGPWLARFDRAAEIRPLQGGESVIAARLEGTQPALIIVRFDPETATITPDWRVVDLRAGFMDDGRPNVAYAIRTAADMERRRQWISMICEAGVAT